MSTITCKDPVNYAFMEFQALETLEYFWISNPKKPYQKVPPFKATLTQGTSEQDETRTFNAINRITGEGVYVSAAGTCVHPYVATIELTPQTVDPEVPA